MSRVRGRHGRGVRILELAFLIALPIAFHFALPLRTVIVRPYSFLGLALMALGLGVNIWAARLFREAGTGTRLEGGGAALVISGPYRFTRNPMYLGMLLWLTGMAVLLGSLMALVFPILFFLVAQVLMIPPEEKRMESIWKEQYVAYRRRVRRWI
jgi:protein-S-isoprenylcysteine O-methyltransferase Ste14